MADAMDSKSIQLNPQVKENQAVMARNGEAWGKSGGAGNSKSVRAEPPVDPQLAIVTAAWTTLPPAIKAGIIAMIRSQQ
jgi:hypothetical protein